MPFYHSKQIESVSDKNDVSVRILLEIRDEDDLRQLNYFSNWDYYLETYAACNKNKRRNKIRCVKLYFILSYNLKW